ncbi:MAG: hypothetical protein R8L07_03340 [Alphaproteobacteria bacterium]|nr:hypothetical protein [Alphaproteobacteria bacterium]
MDSKPFWASKTIWANVLSLIATIATVFGLDLGLTPEVQATIIAGVVSIVNIVLRGVTKTGVTAGSGDPGGGRLQASPWMCFVAIFLTLWALAGCAGDAGTRAVTSLAIACDSYATVLQQLTFLRSEGALDAAAIAAVDRANAIADPLCLPGSPVDPGSAADQVRGVVETLKGLRT